MLIFEVCLPLKKLLVTTLIETREFTSRIFEVKLTFQNHQKTQITLVALLRFALE